MAHGIPRVWTKTKKIHSPISRCGDNWAKRVKIRAPYKDIDVGFRKLPPLGSSDQIRYFDDDFVNELNGDSKRIREFIHQHDSVLHEKQRINLHRMMDRADQYITDATRIQNTWAEGFSTPSHGQLLPWPLGTSSMEGTKEELLEGHSRDEKKWQKLVRGALKNLRCSEELAKKATVHHRNKEIWHERRGRRFSFVPQNMSFQKVVPIVRKAAVISRHADSGPICRPVSIRIPEDWARHFSGPPHPDISGIIDNGVDEVIFIRKTEEPDDPCAINIPDDVYTHVIASAEMGPSGIPTPVHSFEEWQDIFGGGLAESVIAKQFQQGQNWIVFTRPAKLISVATADDDDEDEEVKVVGINVNEIPVPEPDSDEEEPGVILPDGDEELEGGEIDLEDKAKKTDNSMLIAAGIGLGALVILGMGK